MEDQNVDLFDLGLHKREHRRYGGQTIRHFGHVTYKKNSRVTCDRTIVRKNKTTLEASVTQIDIDYGLCRNIKLNDHNEGKEDSNGELENALETACIEKRSWFVYNRNSHKVRYTVPVIGTMLLGNPSHVFHRWVSVNGKLYDPDFIYKESGFNLVKVAKKYIVPPTFTDKKIIKLENTTMQRSGNSLCHSTPNFLDVKNYHGSRKEMEDLLIHFKSPQQITHLGTVGLAPRARIQKSTLEKQWGTLVVLSEAYSQTSVDSFELQYQDPNTHKWVSIGIFGGNDMFTENLIDLSPYFNTDTCLLTAHLKMIPMKNKPFFRIAIYGYPQQVVQTQNEDTNQSVVHYWIHGVDEKLYRLNYRKHYYSYYKYDKNRTKAKRALQKELSGVGAFCPYNP